MSGPAPSGTPLLDRIDSPADLRRLAEGDLPALAAELRQEMIDAVSATGGHLGAGLGVVELTIALHYVFDTPRDRLIWDVGHQAYPHKMLTGRRGRLRTLRQKGGLSGFTRRAESEYDPFGTAHAATSVSAALGMAVAAELRGEARRAVAVIGDGAMTAGMAYEALNHAGSTDLPLVVVLNDNNMSIAPPTGAMSAYLARLISSRQVRRLRARARRINDRLPRGLADLVRRADRSARALLVGGTLFDELGFYYIGPVDGHRLDRLLPILKAVRDMPEGRPVLVHAVTRKGCGYPPAEESEDKFHGVSRFDVVTGRPTAKPAAGPSYSAVFGDTLRRLARGDPRIAAVTAAMPGGTGLDRFAAEHPGRCFDVGIAEQHAVTFAAGLAAEGMRPFVAIYSTFLQRALDQVIHDVAVQGLPVRFAIDRAGLVGADGPTHAGSFDTAFLANLPGFVVMAAADEAELARMLATQQGLDGRPSAVRYPRGTGPGAEVPEAPAPLEVGRGRVLREGSAVALLSYGARLGACLEAADLLAARGLPCTVADARFCRPLDEELVLGLADSHDVLLVVEEGAVGGFGSHVLQLLSDRGRPAGAVRSLALPDRFIDHMTPDEMLEEAGLTAGAIAEAAFGMVAARDGGEGRTEGRAGTDAA